jgi:HlyD family secretion protein
MRAGPGKSRSGGVLLPALVGALVVIVAAALGFVLVQGAGSGDRRGSADHFNVARGDFDITIPASGELVAQNQVEVRNRLESRAVVTEIVAEGKTVSQGDLLLRLNDEDIRNRIKDAQDAVANADAQLVAAEATLAIRESAAASEQQRADLQVELAELALRAWAEGEVASRRQQLELSLQTARINFDRLEERYRNSLELFEEQFISHDELQRDNIAMIEADARLKQAQLDIEVYETYTYHQQHKQRVSDLEQAREELTRVQTRHEAELGTARAEVRSRRHQLDSRRDRLNDLLTQLEYCAVYAPTDGLVVYASSIETGGHRRGGGMGDPPQVGTELSRNELVMLLPDTSRMIAAVKVNEALSGLIRPGQRARVISDAQPGVAIQGEVLNVGVLAESGGWRDPNRRDYTVRILLQGGNENGLRPSMRCRAEIFIDRVEDALYVPVQSVFRDGRRAFVYAPVAGRGGYEPRDVRLGRASDLYVEVREGLKEGDAVLLRRPQPGEIVQREARMGEAAAAPDRNAEPQPAAEPNAVDRPVPPEGRDKAPIRRRPGAGPNGSG